MLDTELSEREATPDEAFEIGRTIGYDEGYHARQVEIDELQAKYDDLAKWAQRMACSAPPPSIY